MRHHPASAESQVESRCIGESRTRNAPWRIRSHKTSTLCSTSRPAATTLYIAIEHLTGSTSFMLCMSV
ncbi:hypothetical protein J6590_042516 [Homalodisca vitripennis]|nr:hypothetical protein J6590_042516 [Homalodisca vitripennis]